MSTSITKRFKNSTARIALIDADSVLYAVALSAEAKSLGTGEHGDDEWLQVKDGQECYREIVTKLETLVQAVGAEDAIICLSPTGVASFRSHLLPSYKMNRAGFRRPELLKPLQAMIQERRPFGTLAVRGLEADDVCGISSTRLASTSTLRTPVIVSIDKDMQSIPGLLYSWLHKERGVVEITDAQAERAHLYQTLIGDTVDNYTGCPGMGPKKAVVLLDAYADATGWSRWEAIVDRFKKKGLTEQYALTQARVARILRTEDWDDKAKEIRLWTPPKDNAVIQAVGTSSTTDECILSKAIAQAATRLRLQDILPKQGETVH